MPSPNMFTVYADDVEKSTAFYADVFEQPASQTIPGFAMFTWKEGWNFGIWGKDSVVPQTQTSGGATELGLPLPDNDAVDSLHQQWKAKGVSILQAPTMMGFGYTFTATDPDGNRLRPFAPAQS